MKTELRKVYSCDHCQKTMLSAGAMSRHEKGCNQNPNNWHKCFDYCIHLKKETEVVEHDEEPLRITHFTCDLTNQKMYSYKFEKSGGFKPAYINGLIRMPLECQYFIPKNDEHNLHPRAF